VKRKKATTTPAIARATNNEATPRENIAMRSFNYARGDEGYKGFFLLLLRL
jgi:hypothetical protein